jgi:hypothetical protein
MAWKLRRWSRGSHSDNPERALRSAVRRAVPPTLCLPVVFASVGASATGQGIPLALAWPLAALTVIANVACWLNVVMLWRALPGPEDDDPDWRRPPGSDSPLDPSGGPGGIEFDWAGFERDFWSYVSEHEDSRKREVTYA